MNGLPQALTASQRLIDATGAAVGAHSLTPAGQPVAAGSRSPGPVAAKDLTVLDWPGLTY